MMARKPKQRTKPVSASNGVIAQYYRGLRKLVKQLDKMVDRELAPVFAEYEKRQPVESPIVRDADPTVGLGLEAAFQSLIREARLLDRFYRPLARRILNSENQSHRRRVTPPCLRECRIRYWRLSYRTTPFL